MCHFLGQMLGCAYTICSYGEISISCTSSSHIKSYSSSVHVLHSICCWYFFYWSLRNKVSSVFRAIQSILNVHINVAVCRVSIFLLIANSSGNCSKPSKTIPSVLTAISIIIITLIFDSFLKKFSCFIQILSIFSFSFICGPLEQLIPLDDKSSFTCQLKLSLVFWKRFSSVDLKITENFIRLIIIIIIIITPREFFTSALAYNISLEFKWQQVSSSIQDSSQYSGRSQ